MTNFDKLFKQIMCECNEKLLKQTKSRRKCIVKEGLFTGNNNCSTCHGTGYIKSHCDEPDQPCPRCNSAIPDDIGYDSDNLRDPNEVTDDEIDAIIAQNRINRTSLGDMYNENKKVVKESSVSLPDEIVKCEICGKDITKHVVWDKHYGNQYQSEEKDFSCEDPTFMHQHICLDCAEKEAQQFQNKFTTGQDSEEHVLEFIDNDDGETWIACTGCGQLYPENELRDTDAGMTCDDCIDGYVSRGQEVTITYNRR